VALIPAASEEPMTQLNTGNSTVLLPNGTQKYTDRKGKVRTVPAFVPDMPTAIRLLGLGHHFAR
jgi:hypothetical protein